MLLSSFIELELPTGKAQASLEIFAANLQYLMKSKGVLPGEMAVHLKISRDRLDRWLSKVCYPQMNVLIAICDYLEYTDIYSLLTVKLG